MSRTTFYGRGNVKVTIQPNLGLEANTCQSVVDMLNLLLADEAVLTLKTQHAAEPTGGVGEAAELKSIFTTQTQQIMAISAEITERIQILGYVPLSNTEQMTDCARLRGEIVPVPGIVNMLADHEAFIRFLRDDVRKCSENYDDQGSFLMLINALRVHEKIAWVLRSNITSAHFSAGH